MRPTICPIWGTPAEERPRRGERREIISSRAGGRYAISGDVEIILAHQPLDDRGRELLTEVVYVKFCKLLAVMRLEVRIMRPRGARVSSAP